MVVRFIPSAASRVRCLPTGMEPVNVTLRMMGEGMRCSETSAGTPNTRFSTPRGRPASCRARVIATAVPGVSSEGLRMHEHPPASAPAILRAGVTAGKFHGVTSRATPTGWWSTMMRLPPAGARPMVPVFRTASSANQRKNSAA